MDDLKGTKQGEPQQGTVGQTSQGTEGTSQDIPETLTREQVQKLISDERAKAGRELKAARAEAESYKTSQAKLDSELTETRNRMSEIQRRIDEADEEDAKGSPDALKLYQKQKALREKEAAILAKEREVDRKANENAAELTAAKEAKTEMAIVSAAVEHHVDIGKLKEKVQKLGLTTNEQISEMAETLAGQPEGDKKKIPQGDSGRTIGGGTDEDGLKARYPTMYK